MIQLNRAKPAFLTLAFIAVSMMTLSACTDEQEVTASHPAPFLVKELGTLQLDESLSGLLSRHSAVNPRDGSLYQTYQIDLEQNSIVSITAEGGEFTPSISFFSPDGTPLGSAAGDPCCSQRRNSLIRSAAAHGPHLVVISGNAVGDMGSFSVTVTGVSEGGELEFPGTTSGILFRSDVPHPTTGSAMRVYPLELDEEGVLDIRLSSNDFDAFLSLVDSTTGNVVAENDDWGTSSDSRIIAELPAGNYEIWASAYHGTGHYTLTTELGEIERSESFNLGELYQGFLGHRREPIATTSHSGDALSFTVEETMTLDAFMRSEEVDAYLFLTDSSGSVIAENDDYGHGTDSRIVETLEPGTYTLWASSYGSTETGAYQVEASLLPTEDQASVEL